MMNNNAHIVLLNDPEGKSGVAASVLAALPEWFGIPESTQTYIQEAVELPLWAAFDGDQAIGFVTLKPTARYTAEVHCMGVLPQLHRQGIGRALMAALMGFARNEGYRLVQVKTVDAGHYPEYDRTIAFYEAMGFTRLEVFPDLWDAHNPCLVLVKAVAQADPHNSGQP